MSRQAPPARLIRRLAAGCYDLLILTGLFIVTSFFVVVARGGASVPAGNLAYEAFLGTQAAAYFIGLWARGGQTVGMRAWQIRVETREGQALTLRVAALRFAAALLSAAVLGLGFLWALVDASGATWHDRLSGTRVVLRRPAPGPGALP